MLTEEQIADVYRRLPTRSQLIFLLGLETGLRISDILRIKIKDLVNPLRIYVARLDTVVAHQISEHLFDKLLDCAYGRFPDYYLFPSTRSWRRHLHRTTYHRDIKRAVDELPFSCSAHSTRKYFLVYGF
jgi:integrase